ncbi:MAG: hypothetical protein IKP46_01265 [Bacteroidales bacterium]|nr:hypothetical protein [Bacteroidales bacterium]
MKRSSFALFTAAVAASLAFSCVPIDEDLGKNLISTKAQFHVFTGEYPLGGLETRTADDLSGFSNSRIVIGAVRDADYGVSKRSSAFTLVPAIDTLDFGEDPEVVRFYLHLACDTTCIVPGGEYNLQRLSVYALKDTLDFVDNGTNKVPETLPGKVSLGSPVINGRDSLRIEFTKEFGQKYVDGILSLFDKDGDGKAVLAWRDGNDDSDEDVKSNRAAFTEYNKLLPGVLVEADDPVKPGGRFDMFRISCFSIAYDSGSSAYYYRNNNIGILRVKGTFKGVRRDTAYLFLPGELEFLDENSYLSNRTKFYQYAFNATVQDPVTDALKADRQKACVEGGGGMKPVVCADSLGRVLYEDIVSKGGDPSYTVVNKGTLILPFEDPATANPDTDYSELDLFPEVLSPTCCIVTTVKDGETEKETKTFAALADASSSAEDQGDINRSLCRYNPDITHHLQQILKVYIEKVKKLEEAGEAGREDVEEEYRKKLANYDIWFLNVHDETVETISASSYDNDYYRNLLYAQYYNSLYGGYGYGSYGYGYGYGDYGGYGYGSNYYSLAMLNALYSGSGTTTTTTQELDTARFYKAILNGPETSSDAKPSLVVTYSFPKE